MGFYDDLKIEPLTVSNSLLQSPLKLRERFDKDGYIYLAEVVDPPAAQELLEAITAIFSRQNLLLKGSKVVDAIPDCEPANEGEDRYFALYDEIQKLECFHAMPHRPELINALQQLLGPTAFPHPLGVARLSFPSNTAITTPPHQDYPNNQGTPDLYAGWIPLTDCPQEMGGLAILPESHKQGILPLDFSLGPGNRQAIVPGSLKEKAWLSTDYKAGDLIIFHSHTLHCSLPNLSNRMRLSVDYRYQREGEDITERCLKSHFERLSWEEIYAGWKSDRLKYYWKSLNLSMIPWSDDYHKLPPEHINEAVKLKRAYERNRAKPS